MIFLQPLLQGKTLIDYIDISSVRCFKIQKGKPGQIDITDQVWNEAKKNTLNGIKEKSLQQKHSSTIINRRMILPQHYIHMR